MNEHHEIDGDILALLGGADDPSGAARGCIVAERRLDDVIAGRAQPVRRRRFTGRPLAVALACGVVLASGVAVAATTDLADRILGSREPSAERIGAIREDTRPLITQDELMETFRGAIVKRQIGDRIEGEFSRPLVQDDRARVSARRTTEGGVCMTILEYVSLRPGETARWRPGGAACGAFADGWPLMDVFGANGFTGSLSYGLVADGVAQVRFIVHGETLDATMGDGAYLWRNPPDARPSDIEVVLDDGTVVRRDLTWLRSPPHGPPPAPRIVS